jgi:hypothetical protein
MNPIQKVCVNHLETTRQNIRIALHGKPAITPELLPDFLNAASTVALIKNYGEKNPWTLAASAFLIGGLLAWKQETL